MSIGGFIRHSVANKEVKEAPPADVPYLIRAMRQAGYNLDQTLKRFNSTNVPDMPQFRKGLEELRTASIPQTSRICPNSEKDWRNLERRRNWSPTLIPPARVDGSHLYLADQRQSG